ncbi:hypothetical protein V2J09_022905 [Rumex salicifolius]
MRNTKCSRLYSTRHLHSAGDRELYFKIYLSTGFCTTTLCSSNMANELVSLATNEKLSEMNWTKNIEICELVAKDQRQAKDVIKAIKKRLGSKRLNVQLYAVLLLEMLMNNIGEPIHKQVIELGLLPILVKIVKKKSDMPVREKIFLLLDATQTSVGGAKGKFPQYYNAYYELVSAGVQFSQNQHTVSTDHTASRTRQINLTVRQIASGDQERTVPREEPKPQAAPESSIIKKATAALEVLREVLDAIDPHNPEAGKDEFTLDLVEQCSFEKQRIMHLVMSSRDERLVSRAIELNEQLGRVLERHDALFLDRPQRTSNHVKHNNFKYEDTEHEDEPEQLSHRIRKGKARLRPEDEDKDERPFGLLTSSIPNDKQNRPLIRPLIIEPQTREPKSASPNLSIPPPPAKHTEREKFFQEKGDVPSLSGHMRDLSLHSRNPSSSFSESTTSNE